MTHLRIEQNNGITEQVSPSVIEKLYEIVHSGNLDSSSNLMGSLNTTGTYLNYVDYLEELFTKNGVRLLVITANKLYISFEDPAVASYWANSTYGDGTGIDSTSAASVLSIPNSAFKDNTSIQTFDELGRYFPNCTTLNYYNFYGASNLRSIDTSNITTLGLLVFNGCSIPGVFNLPKLSSITDLSNFSFLKDTTEINIGSDIDDSNKITVVPGRTFLESKNLTKITGLSKVTSTGYASFYNCSELLLIDTSSELTTVGELSFRKTKLLCIDLTNVTSAGPSAFESTNLVDLATSDPTLINTGAATYTFNWSVVNSWVFYQCPLTNKSFNFPNATSVGLRAFYLCSGVKIINAPSVTSLPLTGAFELCGAEKITINNVSSFPNTCFYNCTNLTEVNFGLTELYNSSTGYIDTTDTHVLTINEESFRGCTNLFKSLKTIGQDSGYLKLILTNCTTIGNRGFYGSGLRAIYCPALTTVGVSTFAYCHDLKYAELPVIDSIPYSMFYSCENLLNFTIPNTVTSIGNEAFRYSGITGVVRIPANITSLGVSVWHNCDNITAFIFEGNVPPTMNNRSVYIVNSKNPLVPIYVPDAALSDYLTVFASLNDVDNVYLNRLHPISDYNPS